MFCSNCGSDIKENVKFCPNCGKEQKVTNKYEEEGQEIKNEDVRAVRQIKPHNKKKVLFAILGSAVGIILILILIFTILFNSDKNVIKSIQETTVEEWLEYITNADKFMAEHNYDEAMAVLDTAIQLYGENDELKNKKMEVSKNKGLFYLGEYETKEEYRQALEYIDSNMAEFLEDTDILNKRNLYISKYREQVIGKADKALESEGYEKAIAIVNEGLEILNDDSELTKKYDEYMTYAPAPLTNFTVVTGEMEQEEEIGYDLLGNAYAPPNLFSVNQGWGSDGTSVVYLKDNYKKLTGVIAKVESDPFGREEHTLTIYGSKDGDWDNAKIIFHTWLEDVTEPVDFEIEIEKYKYLHFEVSDGGYFYLSDFEFWK